MEYHLSASSQTATSVNRRVLTGVYKGDEEEVKSCGAFSKLLKGGFELYHVGINVHPSSFIQRIKRFSPQVVILFCQGNIEVVEALIEMIKKEQMRSANRIIIYGPHLNESVRDEVHADAYAENDQELFDIVSEITNELPL